LLSNINLTAGGLIEMRSPRGKGVQRDGGKTPVTLAQLWDPTAIHATHGERPHTSLAEPALRGTKRIKLFQTIMCLSLQDEVKVNCCLLVWNQDGKIL